MGWIKNIVFVGISLFFIIPLIIYPDRFVAFDAYYHIALAQDLFHPDAGPWMPYTIYGDAFPSRHFFFQFLLKPFVEIEPYWGSCAYVAVLLFLILWVYNRYFKEIGSDSAFWLSILLVSGSPLFLLRMMQLRPIGLAILYLGLFLLCFKRKRPVYCFILAFFFTWSYSSFVVLFLYIGLELFFNGKERRCCAVFAFSGVLSAYILNPFFPGNVRIDINYCMLKFFPSNLARNQYPVLEWMSESTMFILTDFWIVFFLLFYIIWLKKNASWNSTNEWFVYFCNAGIWTFLMMKTMRFCDYWYPAAMIFLVYTDAMEESPQSVRMDRLSQTKMFYPLLVLFTLMNSYCSFAEFQKKAEPMSTLQEGAVWLRDHSKTKETVVLSSIDSYAEMLYHNRKNVYLVGMDWQYLQYKNPSLASEYADLMRGKIDLPSRFLEQHDFFYLFIDKKDFNPNLKINCEKDFNLNNIYEDMNCCIYSLRAPLF